MSEHEGSYSGIGEQTGQEPSEDMGRKRQEE